MLTIALQRTLTQAEDESLNKLDNQITMLMLKVEKRINCKQTSPLSPELHIAIRTVTLWKLTLTQLKTNISQHKNITSIQQTLPTTIHLNYENPADLFNKLKNSKTQSYQNKKRINSASNKLSNIKSISNGH